ncbi:MAG: hypothetical protein WCT14_22235 [Treponemataceae bacterium]
MKKVLAIVSLVALLSGCATIVSGTKQKVKISSEPNRAQIVITAASGQEFYKGGPTEIELPRNNAYTVEITMAGYQPQKVMITKGFNAWFVGNLLCGGIPGGVVDLLTGAMWNLEPDTINLTLKTALLETETGPVLVFFANDENGELRSMTVPMIKA